jgi:hypothetical protein
MLTFNGQGAPHREMEASEKREEMVALDIHIKHKQRRECERQN